MRFVSHVILLFTTVYMRFIVMLFCYLPLFICGL